jgi:transposase
MSPLYGWAEGRATGYAPDERYEKKTTIISMAGLVGPVAPMAFPGALNGQATQNYLINMAFPSMKEGQTIILDNCSSHKAKGVIDAAAEHKTNLLFLPPYSPDFNPIEHMWPKLKDLIRKSMPRNFDDLVEAIGNALDKITPEDAKGWFLHCGYSC